MYQLLRISSSIDEELRSRAKDVAIKKKKKKKKEKKERREKKEKERRSNVVAFAFIRNLSHGWPVQLPSFPERIFTVVQTVANYRYVMPIVPEETSIHSFSLVAESLHARLMKILVLSSRYTDIISDITRDYLSTAIEKGTR